MVKELGRGAEVGDVPLAYHADTDGRLIVFQHADRVVAFDSDERVETWSVALEPDTLALSGVRVPVLGPRACYVVSGEQLLALDRRTGAPRWRSLLTYDRALVKLNEEQIAEANRRIVK